MIKPFRTLPFVTASALIGFLGPAACATSAGPGNSNEPHDGGSNSSSGSGSGSSSGSNGGSSSGSGGNSSSGGGSSSSNGGGSSSSGSGSSSGASSSGSSSGSGSSSSGGSNGDDWLTTPTPANSMGSFPFPQDRKSSNCSYPVKISHAQIQSAYMSWLTNLTTSMGAPSGGLRVIDPMSSSQTTSEGMAYGMLIAVYMSDKKTFDSLWTFVQMYRNNNLMDWQIPSGGSPSGGMTNSASDADEDMAWALIMADKQWPGGSYLTTAKSMLSSMKSLDVNSSNNIKDGDYSSAGSTHPDYAAPDYYKVFATVSGDSSWNSVYTAEYGQLSGAQNSSTGLIPDATGQGTFGFDACRAPWRVGLDYCWSGSSNAKSFLTPMVAWFMSTSASGATPANIKIPVSTSGGTGQNASGAITGPAAVAAMMSSSNQTLINNSWTYLYQLVNQAASPGNLNYFSATLGLVSMLALSGNFVDYTNPPP